MVRIPTHREPTHPGEVLLKEFLEPMGPPLNLQQVWDLYYAIRAGADEVSEIRSVQAAGRA